MTFVDSHCHLDRLDLTAYSGELAKALDYAHSLGVNHMLSVCVDLESFPIILAIAENHPKVSASVGVHPTELISHEPTKEDLIKLACHPKIVALGETGLDYYRLDQPDQCQAEQQRERFRQHIRAAKQVKKPLIVHTREAREDTIRILEEEGAADIGGVMHCFTEDWAMAQQALDLNFYISMSGIVTFKNATQVQDVARRVPLDKMLIETDSPYLAPVPYRGKTNQPAYVVYVAEYIANLRGESLPTIATQTTNNFFKLFSYAKP